METKKIIFLHHSTGQMIWYGKTNRYIRKLTDKSDVKTYIKKYNRKHKTGYYITKIPFPSGTSYKGSNSPFDYYNIWVKNAGGKPYMDEPTLDILTEKYDIIIFKHCYPVSKIMEDSGNPDIDSAEKRIENYKLQYDALKKKMHSFPETCFIIWTPAVMVKNKLTREEALRTKEFYEWMMNEWDEKGDNIFLFDFYKYETDGGLFLKNEHAVNPDDSHPNRKFAGRVAPLFAQFIIDVADHRVE
ncbi:MAG: hypothetical protein RQ743_11975 [Bacteroidales bacterium]|nr:hypothetical protein [Bacteroidales bacterium]